MNTELEIMLEEAVPHTANVELDVLNEDFHDKVLSNLFLAHFRFCWSWPAYSTDLNPYDYSLCSLLTGIFYRNYKHTFKELKQEILLL
jgi:hypothetical protein